MADFRKWIYALAIVALLAGFTIPASAQIQCNTASGVPPTVRAEGYTELMGDLILNCSGGVPTGPGAAVPKVDIQIFLSTNVTSRLLTTSTSLFFNEALLIFDEPNSPVNPTRHILACGGSKVPSGPTDTGGAPDNGPNGPGVCSIISTGNPSETYNGVAGQVGLPSGTTIAGASGVCTTGAPVTSTGSYGCGRPNVFQGRQALAFANGGTNNSVIWPGVPFDPPGTTTTRTIRITNVRGNAVGVGVSSTFTVSQIQMNISISGNNSLSINNPQQIVAFVQRGLNVTIAKARPDFIQCNSENPDLYAVGNGQTPAKFTVPAYRGTNANCVGSAAGSGLSTTRCDPEGYNMAAGYNSALNGIYPNGSGATNVAGGLTIPTDATPTVRFIEGFPSAWKMRNISELSNATLIGSGGINSPGYQYNGGLNFPGDQNQNVPGANYNTESGFENFAGSGSDPAPNPPTGYASGITAATPSLDNGYGFTATNGLAFAGVANHGTRLALNFTNIPKGTNLWIPPIIYLYRQDKTLTSTGGPNGDPTVFVSGFSTGVMVLVTTDANGGNTGSTSFPGSGTVPQTSTSLQQVTGSLAVYEILYTDPFSYEQADVPVVVAYNSDLTNNLPQTGLNTQVAGGFAPFYTGAVAAAASTIGLSPDVPRFIPASAPATLFTISACSCNLLFPFVANVGGFDTGIAIANTSLDPGATFGFKGKSQIGTVQFWYYGSILATGAPAPGPQTSNPVPAGQILTYVLSTGGGSIGSGTSSASGLDNRAAGFEGYIIAQAGFQYCHAYAFISAQGAGPTTNGTSEGYLGIVLDGPGLPRTNQIGENDAH